MKQSLIDKFKPNVNNLSEAKLLQNALEVLPDETIVGEIDSYSFPRVFLDESKRVHLCYDTHIQKMFSVVFPQGAKNSIANGSVCLFDYEGIRYQIN